jgi:hypothetical protein
MECALPQHWIEDTKLIAADNWDIRKRLRREEGSIGLTESYTHSTSAGFHN